MAPAAAGAAVAAALLLVAGALLDWSGVEYSSTVDRRIVFACGVVSLVVGASLPQRRFVRLLAGLLAAAGVVAANMAAVNILDVGRHRHEFASYPEASVGVGLWLVAAGAALAVAASTAAWLSRS